jgi:hypothetical protein
MISSQKREWPRQQRRWCFTMAKTSSQGFSSGEYLGRKINLKKKCEKNGTKREKKGVWRETYLTPAACRTCIKIGKASLPLWTEELSTTRKSPSTRCPFSMASQTNFKKFHCVLLSTRRSMVKGRGCTGSKLSISVTVNVSSFMSDDEIAQSRPTSESPKFREQSSKINQLK